MVLVLIEQEMQKRIQICSHIGGQRGRLWNKRYRKRYRYAARYEDREERMVLVSWNKRSRKGCRYAARYRSTERTEWCWVYGTRDTEKDTDTQLIRGQQKGQNGAV
jgi:hypothetical protein